MTRVSQSDFLTILAGLYRLTPGNDVVRRAHVELDVALNEVPLDLQVSVHARYDARRWGVGRAGLVQQMPRKVCGLGVDRPRAVPVPAGRQVAEFSETLTDMITPSRCCRLAVRTAGA